MKVSQEDWDAIWERSEGKQKVLFDDNGVPEVESVLKSVLKFPILKVDVLWGNYDPS